MAELLSYSPGGTLLNQLDHSGLAVVQCEPTRDDLTSAAMQFGQIIQATSIGIKSIEGVGSDASLLKHTESITQGEEEMLEYFALGCLKPADSGGETTVYDARKAAQLVQERRPELSDVKLLYTSTVYDGQSAIHPLVVKSPKYGPVVRYRSKASTNKIISGLPEGVTEEGFYESVEAIIDESLVKQHTWKPGELLIVNNPITVHSRLPYTGERRMVRFRYNDPHFRTVMLK